MLTEFTIILKGEDKVYKEKALCYNETIELSVNSPLLHTMINDAKASFNCEVEEVCIKASIQWE